MRRYAKVTGAVGGMAFRVAGQRYLGLDFGHRDLPVDLKEALGGLKGPLMKVAQILGTIPDALPQEYLDQLRQLQANAPSMGRLFVRRRMRAELGEDWASHFAEFDETAVAAASLGQVHWARSLDGRALAAKLQYPDMSSIVEADLNQLRFVISIYERYDKAIQASEIYEELVARMREELDYQREAAHMRLYRVMLKGETSIHVPEPMADLSTDRLLTMTWLNGEPLLAFIAANKDIELRNRVAFNMFRAWYVPFYRYGVIHGDPHLGNYNFRQNGDVNVLDFGCIRVFRPDFVKGVIDLYHGLSDENEELVVEAYRVWGFSNLDRGTIEVLNHWARFVYAPLMEDKTQRIQETNTGVYGREVVEKVHSELRRLNGVRPPREFVLMDRAAIGLGSVFLHLGAEINWYRLFHDLIEDFDLDAVGDRQASAMASAEVSEPA